MSSIKDSIRIDAGADEQRASDSFYETTILLLCALLVALIVVLAGYATPGRPPDSAPPVQISERIWQQVDSDIANASSAATESAWDYARVALDHWISLVQILSKQLHKIQRRYGVPSDQFDRRIKDISAIALSPHPAHSASLYQFVHTV